MRFDTEKKCFLEEDRSADKAAFIAADKTLNWQELKTLSDIICEVFSKIGIPKGYSVLLYGDKEAVFLSAIVSCFRMGIAFVPLSPAHPKKRIEKIIQQTGSRVLFVCGNYEDVPSCTVTIDTHLNVSGNTELVQDEKDLAYILFTSGSSGEPKGVMISAQNIIAFIKWFTSNFGVTNETIYINQADFSFDISLADLFGALHTGGTAIFNNGTTILNEQLFFERINKYKGSYWNSTPSFVSRYLASKNFNSGNLPTITKFVLSGEDLSPKLVKELMVRFPKATIINAYGPTETTIYAGYAEITKEMTDEKTLPICKSDQVLIDLKDGKIIISGPSVGMGYLNDQDLSAKKFISGSFVTGDLARERNGYIYYDGRKDDQLKFNGYRIEPGEIKHVLEKIENIKQAECIPVVIENKVKRLIAFVVTKQEQLDKEAVLNALKTELPSYMIPSEIVVVKEFPVTSSFKSDRKKLLDKYLNGD